MTVFDSRFTTLVETLGVMTLAAIPSWYTIDAPESGQRLGSFADNRHIVLWAWLIGTLGGIIHAKWVIYEQRLLVLEESSNNDPSSPAEPNHGETQETVSEP